MVRLYQQATAMKGQSVTLEPRGHSAFVVAAPTYSLGAKGGNKVVRRVSGIRPSGEWDVAQAADRAALDAGDRHRRRLVITGEKGTTFLLDLPKPVTLRDGDGLVLDDGSTVLVAGAPEALIEVSAHSPRDVVRLAWHLGNRHTDIQIVGGRLRIRRDHVLEDMLRGLGAALMPLEAPFDPESSAPQGHQGYGHGG